MEKLDNFRKVLSDECAIELPGFDTSKKYTATVETIKQELRRTVREIFTENFPCDTMFEVFFPSTSANYINSRSKMGSVPCVMQVIEDLGLGKEAFDEAQIRMETRIGPNDQFDDFHLINKQEVDCRHALMYLECVDRAIEEEPLVTTIGLKEPLKCRTISKGPPLTSYVLKPVQKYMFKKLREFEPFRLIGEPISDEHFIEFLEKNSTIGRKWLSGDYKASTDNLHSWVSEEILACLKEECWDFGDEYQDKMFELMKRLLTEHIFDYDDQKMPQEEGQLMGSVISFPFLCIANFALCRMSMEMDSGYNVMFSLNDCPVLVNGDDCLFPLDDKDIWERLGTMFGLSSSIGKTWHSGDCVTLNTTLFYLVDGVWKRAPKINFGLLLDSRVDRSSPLKSGGKRNKMEEKRKKLEKVERYEKLSLIGPHLHEVKKECPPELWLDLKKIFIKNNIELLKSTNLSWFVPQHLGGLGLPMDTADEISWLDRQKVSIMLHKGIEPAKLSTQAEWQMHRFVQREYNLPKIPEGTRLIEGHSLKEFDDTAYSYAVYKLLYTRQVASLKIAIEVDDALKFNERLHWRLSKQARNLEKVFKDGSAYECLSSEEIYEFEESKMLFPIIAK